MEALITRSNPSPEVLPPSDQGKPHPFDVGTVLLGRYLLMRLIARGGTSYIYCARDTAAVLDDSDKRNQDYVALKVIKSDMGGGITGSEMLLHEILTTRHLVHPNIIKIYEYHHNKDVSLVAMEFIQGESLDNYLRRSHGKKLAYHHAMTILQLVAEALQTAHEEGIVHSDVKPGNILVGDDGDVKVIDFAVARIASKYHRDHKKLNSNAAFRGFTLAYASPESIADLPAHPRDDVFSLACIVYEVIVGKHPYHRHAADKIKPAFRLKRPSEIGFWQWYTIRKALSLDANDRIQSVGEFMWLFTHARRLWWYFGVALALLVVGAIGAHLFIEKLETYQQESTVLTRSYQQQQAVLDQVARIRQLPPHQRIESLVWFNQLPELLHLGALAQLHNDVVVPIQNHVENALNYDSDNIPDFTALHNYVDAAMVYYPQSSMLLTAQQKIITEKQQLISLLTLQARKLWRESDFSLSSAAELNALNQQLEIMAPERVVGPGEVSIAQYRDAVATAVNDLNYSEIHQLFEFPRHLVKSEQLKAEWDSIDHNIPEAARLLVEYVGLQDVNNTSYPALAMKYFVNPFFRRWDKRISSAWRDKEIIAVKDALYSGVAIFSLPKNLSLYKRSRAQLVSKLKLKISHHNKRSNWHSAQKLTQLMEDIRDG